MNIQTEPQQASTAIRPFKLAHVVFKTSRYQEQIAWYKTVLSADVVFGNDFVSFLSYDEEHHRIALVNVPNLTDLKDLKGGTPGFHHVAFTFETLRGLMDTYVRLRDLGIKPVITINHGPTISLYYEDLDANQVEFQIDNFDTIDEATAFFYSDEFAENPVGVLFEAEEFLTRLNNGESEVSLKKRPRISAEELSKIKLRG